MTTVYKYRVRCTTDNTWETVWSETLPTVCPVNTAHTIDSSLTTITEKISKELVSIQEEEHPTGGHYQTTSIKIEAAANTVTESKVHWPYGITALAINFVTDEENYGDRIDMYAGKDITVGALTSFVAPVNGWVQQNYTAGQKVTYSHAYHDDSPRVYTCVANTVGNALPINLASPLYSENTTYWKHGYEVSVTDSVITNADVGFYVRLTDGANATNMGRVVSIDQPSKKVYLEKNPDNSYSPLSPTYYQQRVYFIKDYLIDKSWNRDVGQAKIGGAYIPPNMYVHAEYTNISANIDKVFVGHAEILY